MHFAGESAVGDVVRVRVDRATLVALNGVERAVVQATPHRAPPLRSRTRLPVVSA